MSADYGLNVAGRVAVISGGSRGIGRAVVLKLAEAGAHVVVNFLRDERAARTVVKETESLVVRAVAVRADVSMLKDAEKLVQAAIENFGRLDYLICNAGIWEGALLAEMTEELWDRVLTVNLKGTWTLCRAAVPFMVRNGFGRIVIVSSTAGQRGEAGYSNYAASKGGQISFAKSLAAELAPEIRVNCVAPGWVDTEMNDPVFRDNGYRRATEQNIPLGRIATADDVAL